MKEVFSNKELRETLESYNIDYAAIDSFSIKMDFKKWASYEEDVRIENLDYKGYKYELHGGIAEKYNDAEIAEREPPYGPYKKFLKEFLDELGDREVNNIDEMFSYTINGESDHFFVQQVKWLNETPKEIIKEFENKHKSSKYSELISSNLDNIVYGDGGSTFFEERNNVWCLTLRFDIGEKKYEIRWINKSV